MFAGYPQKSRPVFAVKMYGGGEEGETARTKSGVLGFNAGISSPPLHYVSKGSLSSVSRAGG